MNKYYSQYFKIALKSHSKMRQPVLSPYLNVGYLDTSIGSTNQGDIIINDAVSNHLNGIFEDSYLTRYPTHLYSGIDSQVKMSQCDFLILAGTNLLSSNMDSYFQWKIGPSHKRLLNNKVVLMGVGWWQYQDQPNAYTSKLLRSVLSKDLIHSVRDNYTKEMLNSIGIDNVVNTTCPTLWNIDQNLQSEISPTKSKDVITTLTFYKKDVNKDLQLLKILEDNYANVYLWVQGLEDLDYLNEIYPNHKLKLIPPSVEAFNRILETSKDIEYLGTRLHAGIRSIQKGRRTLIVAVDNRAVEIAKDTGLNVIERNQVEKSLDFIMNPYHTQIKPPFEKINLWKNQFEALKNEKLQLA